jgi:hypothetical protein
MNKWCSIIIHMLDVMSSNPWTYAPEGKVYPRTGHESPQEDYWYSCTLPLTSALDGVGSQRYPRESDPVPIV